MKIKNNMYRSGAKKTPELKSKNQYGFTLLEVFIALVIGLVLFAGVLSIFVGMRTTVSETSSYGELQENGRLAINILSDDLLRQDFWGDYTGTIDLTSINPVPSAPTGECAGGGTNNGTFPLAVGHFRTLWGETVDDDTVLPTCRSGAVKKSDVLQLKRVISTPLGLVAGDTAPVGNYYFMSNMDTGEIFASGTVPDVKNARVWEYQHHMYYVKEEASVPVLMQVRLSNTLNVAPLVDGIELIRFEYGIDTDIDPTTAGYGIVDAYVSADNMTDALWDNEVSRIISVKMYVLARGVLEDTKYVNKNTYKLGSFDYDVDDNYRRLLFSSTVTLYNASKDTW